MSDSAFEIYKSLSYGRIDEMIADGEEESLHLECKAPSVPRLDKGQQFDLARALSGFSNTAGGIVLWGVSTTQKKHPDTDVLTQIEPIGNCRKLERDILATIPTLTTPPVLDCQSKPLFKQTRDTRGLIATYVPKATGDPVQSAKDNLFYFRAGDRFEKAPYEIIRRLFAATQSPDLRATLDVVDGFDPPNTCIAITVRNHSSAVAGHVVVTISSEDSDSYTFLHAHGFLDSSHLNPGTKLLVKQAPDVVHRGLPLYAGRVECGIKNGKGGNRVLNLTIGLFADRMIARECHFSVLVEEIRTTITDKGITLSY